jgi:hypothetical protein
MQGFIVKYLEEVWSMRNQVLTMSMAFRYKEAVIHKDGHDKDHFNTMQE